MLIKLVWNHFDWKYILKYNLSILLANYYKFYHVISKNLIIIDQRVTIEYQVVGNHMSSLNLNFIALPFNFHLLGHWIV